MSVVVAALLCLGVVCLSLLSFPMNGPEVSSALNARLLTMLFLAASFFGPSPGWLLTNAQGQGASCFSLGVFGKVLGSTCENYLPFLGVLRL